MSDVNLFVYGELRRAEVLRAVIGRLPEAEPAILEHHARRPNPETGYFEVRSAPGARVAGLLLRHLAEADLRRVDEYEGDGYERVEVSVAPCHRSVGTVRAQTYLASSRSRD